MQLLHFLPNIRSEQSSATSGYTWGKAVSNSNILSILKAAGFPEIDTELGLQAGDIVAERWLVSDDAAMGSLVEADDALSSPVYFRDLLEQNGEALLGPEHLKHHGPFLGCIMKQLDTHSQPNKGSLSVQVHPKPGHPSRPAKPEMWMGSGQIYLGWKHDVTETEIREAYEAGTLESLMNQIELKPEMLVLVAGGTIHAIRYNSFLFEWSMAPGKDDIAKGSLKDATVSPYDRTDGKTPRPGKEDIDGSLQLLRESDGFHGSTQAQLLAKPVEEWADQAGNMQERLFATSEVFVHRLSVKTQVELDLKAIGRGVPMYIGSGSVEIEVDGVITTLQAGQEVFVPFDASSVVVRNPQQGISSESAAQLFFWYAPFPTEIDALV